MPATITHETTAGWKAELATILADTTDPQAREALGALSAALGDYFDHPEHFATILGKIQMVAMSAKDQAMLTAGTFGSVEEIAERLPEGVSITVI